jgi:hypothetical protein
MGFHAGCPFPESRYAGLNVEEKQTSAPTLQVHISASVLMDTNGTER